MLQGEYDIKAIANDTWSGATFTIVVNDVPIDLTDATVEFLVNNNGTVFLTKSNQPTDDEPPVAGGITVTDENAFAIDPFIVTGIPEGIYKYAIRITFADGTIKTYVKGLFTVLKGATDG